MTSKLDILLIENNDVLAANIADYLEARGHRMDFATDGAMGLSIRKSVIAILIPEAIQLRTIRQTAAGNSRRGGLCGLEGAHSRRTTQA